MVPGFSGGLVKAALHPGSGHRRKPEGTSSRITLLSNRDRYRPTGCFGLQAYRFGSRGASAVPLSAHCDDSCPENMPHQ